MKAHIQTLLQASVDALIEQGELTLERIPEIRITHTKDKAFGDFACNIAMMLAKPAGKKPRDVAALLIANMPSSEQVEKAEIAGPGFINVFLKQGAIKDIIPTILSEKEQFGRLTLKTPEKVIVEFVSANPTGPLHVGHGRGAAYGATISNLLEAIGYDVHREYYVNDAGRQMHILATSIWLRYLENHGLSFDFPVNGYKGDYLLEIEKALTALVGDRLKRDLDAVFASVPQDESIDENGEKTGDKEAHIDALIVNAQSLLGEDYHTVFKLGLDTVLDDIKADLSEYDVKIDTWFSEQSLMDNGAIEHALDRLAELNFTYEKAGAIWFKATEFGDEKDRVLKRHDGRTTYFASDVAYHLNKIERGFDRIIDVFGADHHGYVARVRAGMRALGKDDSQFIVPLVQFASLYRSGVKVQMSTRSGSFVTLRELREEIGKDAARFFYVMRKIEQHMDFDLDLAKSQTNENPVFYIQYAYARVCSVMRQLAELGGVYDEALGLASLDLLTSTHDSKLMMLLSRYPEIIQNAATLYEPHVLVNYLRDLASAFHSCYNAEKFLSDDVAKSNARLCLANALKWVIGNGLSLLNVSAPETM
jgi:arginyl-tRNA synthetase